MRKRRRCHVSTASIASRVVPGMLADEHALFLQQPVEQRRLADVRPADDGDARSRRQIALRAGGWSASTSLSRPARGPAGRPSPKPLSRQRLDDLVEQIARRPCRARRRSRRPARTRADRTPSPALRALVVGLVDGQHDRQAGLRAARARSSRRPTRALRGHRRETPADRRPSIARCPWRTTSSCSGSSLAPYSPPVSNSSNVAPPHDDRPRQRVARRAGNRRDDRPAGAGHAVEKGGLPHVRAARPARPTVFSWSSCKVNLASALTA